jgi:hypothetical protein
VGVFYAVEGEEEVVLAVRLGAHEVFDAEKLAILDDCEDALMGIGSGETGELVAGFERDADTGGAAELYEAFEAVIATFPGYADVIKLARAGSDRLLHWVEAVKNFHIPSLPLVARKNRRVA